MSDEQFNIPEFTHNVHKVYIKMCIKGGERVNDEMRLKRKVKGRSQRTCI